ncbi:hypothetical protein DGMP_27510 [Desulfomarina profundi]|uniref:Transposase n=1 Tax=Desulfomarina profundi TaxID=2772557 RepID=A0A8D5JE48_9BACT|nr:hypothetical protein [Desulfomarina profundi]BCL62058.1 hypothetical protein DGMP_27510 [Desulfomarina profundi]
MEFIRHLRKTIEDPYQIILTEYITPTGQTKYRQKFIGFFRGKRKEGLIVIVELLYNGTVVWNIMNTRRRKHDSRKKAGEKQNPLPQMTHPTAMDFPGSTSHGNLSINTSRKVRTGTESFREKIVQGPE